MANRWGKNGNSVRLYFFGSKITADGGDITLSTKAHLVKAIVFPVVMYGCKGWTIKKSEHRRIDAFDL